MELSDVYYMTKENRTLNLYWDYGKSTVLMRFRGANSTNIGSVTIRGTVATVWTNANAYYLDR